MFDIENERVVVVVKFVEDVWCKYVIDCFGDVFLCFLDGDLMVWIMDVFDLVYEELCLCFNYSVVIFVNLIV